MTAEEEIHFLLLRLFNDLCEVLRKDKQQKNKDLPVRREPNPLVGFALGIPQAEH